jgi:hypothetical protein
MKTLKIYFIILSIFITGCNSNYKCPNISFVNISKKEIIFIEITPKCLPLWNFDYAIAFNEKGFTSCDCIWAVGINPEFPGANKYDFRPYCELGENGIIPLEELENLVNVVREVKKYNIDTEEMIPFNIVFIKNNTGFIIPMYLSISNKEIYGDECIFEDLYKWFINKGILKKE